MHAIRIEPIAQQLLSELSQHLSPQLTYHGVHHTIDVVQQAMAIAQREGITSAEDLLLLHTAALYHDSGFLYRYQQHEMASCEKARKELPHFGFSSSQIQLICGLIEATRIPQKANTHLEQILADADLDYLGRNDFHPISLSLQTEFISFGIVSNPLAFEEIQIRFFESHEYFTASSRLLRGPVKQIHYEQLKNNDQQPHSH